MRTALVLAALLTLAGCSDDADPVTAPPSASPSPSVVASPSPSTAPVDWHAPAPTSLGGGWSLGPCDGDAPLVCFSQDGVVRGAGEITSFPVATLPAVQAALPDGVPAALQAHARDYLETFRQDRTTGCGADYSYRADPVRAMTAQGTPVVKTAFSGGTGAATTERVVRWVGLRDGQLVALGITATTAGACAPGEGPELTPEQLAALEPALDRLVEASPLPVGAA